MEFLKTLFEKKDLTADQMIALVTEVMKGNLSSLQQAALLSGLNVKGITAKELAAFVQPLMNKKNLSSPLLPGIRLIAGEASRSKVNIFTIAAFIISGLGTEVQLSCPRNLINKKILLSLDAEKNKKIFEQLRLYFSLPQKFHPALEKLLSVSKQMKVRTIADLAALLLQTSPAQTNIMHASSKEDMLLLIEAARILKIQRVVVLFTPESFPSRGFAAVLRNRKMMTATFSERSFGTTFEEMPSIPPGPSQAIFQGTFNIWPLIYSSLALVFSGGATNLKKSYLLAKNFTLSGKLDDHFLAYEKAVNLSPSLLEAMISQQKEILKRKKVLSLKKLIKKTSISNRDFKKSLLERKPALVPEIHQASSSLIQKFQLSGIRSLCVTSENSFSKQSFQHLSRIRKTTKDIPLLWKGFVIDEYQIYEARYFGADAVVLSLSLLNRDHILHFLKITKGLHMAAVCEIRSDDDLALAIEAQTEMVQISAANITQALRWIKKIPSETIVIFEANTASALKKVSGKVDAIIAGPRVLKINNLSKSIERLMGKRKPLVKFCGVRSWQQALACQKMGIDFIGLNFIPSDPRRISYQLAQQIIQKMKEHKKSGIQFVGVFQDQDLSEVNTAAEKLGLDFIQLSGRELISYIKKCKRPVIKEISLTRISSLNTASRYSAVCKYIALNSFRPSLNHRALKKCSFPYLLGGNIAPDQMKELQSSSLLGFNLSTDLAGSELDFKKVKQALL